VFSTQSDSLFVADWRIAQCVSRKKPKKIKCLQNVTTIKIPFRSIAYEIISNAGVNFRHPFVIVVGNEGHAGSCQESGGFDAGIEAVERLRVRFCARRAGQAGGNVSGAPVLGGI
jgi:hypothetical protein